MSDQDSGRADDAREDGTNAGLWAAIVVVGIVVILGAWVVVWPRSDSNGDTAPTDDATGATVEPDGSPPASEPEQDDETGQEGDCPSMPENDEIPDEGPDVDWEIVNGAALPSSDEHGPAEVDGDVARCFSRTPTGALIASTQIDYRITVARDGVAVAREQTVDGAGQDALVEALEERGWSAAEPGELCQSAAFRFISYTADEAVIAVASRCPESGESGGLQLTESRVRWVDGDWRSVLEPDGSSSPTASALSDLSGMTVWGGV